MTAPPDGGNFRIDRLRIVVAGIGVSGRAAALALASRGARVVVVDASSGTPQQDVAGELRQQGIDVRLGDAETPVPADLVVASPGWRPDQPMLAAAAQAGVEVIGEPELAWRLRRSSAPWLGVTGTNGKTTTVEMLQSILRAAGWHSVAAGNVGLPLVDAVLADPPYDVLAVEISSQQLRWTESVRFAASAILNLAPDHLDWHGSLDDYVESKTRIWTDAIAVGNIDDDNVRRLLPRDARTVSVRGLADYCLAGDQLVEAGQALVDRRDLMVSGPHNIANALAAAALARAAGAPVGAVADGLRTFRPGAHRNQLVATVDGIDFVDDSKATNPHAASASLAAYPSVVWVAGGLLKGVDVEPLVVEHAHRLRAVVLLGRDRGLIADALARHAPQIPVADVDATDTGAMDVAVSRAAALARPGDVVLLAPSAASWDLFRDYADRGDRFAAAARRLGAHASGAGADGT